MRRQARRGYRPAPKTRVVGYSYEADFDEHSMQVLLEKACLDDVVTEFDTGRGHSVWFNGPPGEELRAVKAKVEGLLLIAKCVVMH